MSNTNNFHRSNVTIKPLNISIYTENGQPLNASEIWSYETTYQQRTGFEALEYFARSNKAYIGQKVAYIRETNIDGVKSYSVEHYSIEYDGSLKELGKISLGDEKTISVSSDGVISLIGVTVNEDGSIKLKNGDTELEFTKTVNGVEEQIKYQPVMTSTGITWVPISKTTVEGLSASIGEIETKIGNVTEKDEDGKITKQPSGIKGDIEKIEKEIGNVTEKDADGNTTKEPSGIKGDIEQLEEYVGIPATEDTDPTGLFKAVADEISRATQAESDLSDRIDDITIPVIGVTEGDKVLTLNTDKTISSTISLSYNTESKAIELKGKNGASLGSVDATPFIRDDMLNDVEYNADNNTLVFTWNVVTGTDDDGDPIYQKDEVVLSDIIEPYTQGNGIEITGNSISVKKASDSEAFLTVDDKGVKISGVQDAINSAKEAAISHTDTELGNYQKTSDFNTEIAKYTPTATLESTYLKSADAENTYFTKADQTSFVNDIKDGNKTEWRLLKSEEITKLSKLTVSGDDVTISGKVNADNVDGIETKIKEVVTGAPSADKIGLKIEEGAEVNIIEGIKVKTGEAVSNELTPDPSTRVVELDLTPYYTKSDAETAHQTVNQTITNLSGRVSTNETTISTHTTNISNNTTEITTLKEEIYGKTNAEGNLDPTGSVKARLTALESEAAEHDTIVESINKNKTDIATLQGNYSTLSGTVASHNETLVGKDGSSGLVADVSGLKTTISNHAGRLTALEATDTNANNRLLAIEEKVGKAAEGDNAAITGTLETAINNLSGKMDTAEDEIDTLQTDLNTAEGDINALKGRMDTADENIGDLGGSLSEIAGDITVIQAQIETWAGQVQTIIKRDSNGNKIVAKEEDGSDKRDDQGNLVYETEQIDDHNLSIRQIAAQEVAGIVDGANESYDTLKEIADWIASDITGAASMNTAITKNAEDIGALQTRMTTAEEKNSSQDSILSKLDGDVNTEGSVLNLINANKTYVDTNFVQKTTVATSSILGLVMSSSAENKISVAADGTMEVNSLNINKLTQTTGDTLILSGGSASGN